MRRVGFVLGVSVVMAAMVVLIAGSVLAKDTQPKQTYVDKVVATQYFALPGSAASFRGVAKDIEGDGDPGINGVLDTKITYTGRPGPGVPTDITGGTWMLCSHGFKSPPLDTTVNPPTQIPPECNTGTPDSTIALQGSVRDGTAVWDTDGGTALVPTGLDSPSPPCIPVYTGAAEVEAVFTVTGGTVNGVPVTGKGIGHFKGILDHGPFTQYTCPGGQPLGTFRATLEGTLELKF
jgi:hypothetical protein